MRVTKALIPVAGLGTRFLPATKVVPKELLPIVDRPALEIIVEELLASGIQEVVLVISREKEAIFDHFSKGGSVERLLGERKKLGGLKRLHELLDCVSFTKAYQDEPKGLGHAVWCGRKAVGDEPFVVVLPDDLVRAKIPVTQQLLTVVEKEGCSVVAVEKVAKEKVSAYGIVNGPNAKGSHPFRITQMVEKPSVEKAPSCWGIIGRYVLPPDVFPEIEKVKPGAMGEIQLTDALLALARQKGLMAVPFSGHRLDIGQPHGFIEANIFYALDRAEMAPLIRQALARVDERL